MNAERLKIGDQVVVKTVPAFAAHVVKKGDRARVTAVLKDGKKVQYKFRFSGYGNLGRRSRQDIQLPRKLFARADDAARIPRKALAKLRAPRQPKAPGTPLQTLHACQALMELLIDKLSVLEKFNAACTPALPGLQLPQDLA